MTETYGRTDMLYCGCTEDADGYIAAFCDQHGGLYPPPARDEEDEDETPDPAREIGRQRAAELFAESPEWLGI